jgi:methyl-accepting chemotaxis protein
MQQLLQFLLPQLSADDDVRRNGQLPYIAITTSILLVVFIAVIAVTLFANGVDSYFFCMLAIFAGLVSAIVLLRRGNYAVATWLLTAVLLGASLSVLFFMSYSGMEAREIYRPFAFAGVMASVNVIVSLRKRQIVLFCALFITGWIISFATIFRHYIDENQRETISILCVGIIGIGCESAVLALVRSLSDKLIAEAEEQGKKAKESLDRLSAVLAEAREGMGIGGKIVEECETTSAGVARVAAIQEFLAGESGKLVGATARLGESSKSVLDSSNRMNDGISAQNEAIARSSATLTQITQKIESTTTIANERKSTLGETVKTGQRQNELVRELTKAFESVRESSEGINKFVTTVQDIASRTSLLSMNASIEAARAGQAGKGFSVVAQEIRSLSGETQKNADMIKAMIDKNEKTVKDTGKIIADFSACIAENIESTKKLIQAIDEILGGIGEMGEGATEVTRAVRKLLEETKESTALVHDVASRIHEQQESFAHFSGFTRELDERVSTLAGAVEEIRKSTERLSETGKLNIEQVKKLQSV